MENYQKYLIWAGVLEIPLVAVTSWGSTRPAGADGSNITAFLTVCIGVCIFASAVVMNRRAALWMAEVSERKLRFEVMGAVLSLGLSLGSATGVLNMQYSPVHRNWDLAVLSASLVVYYGCLYLLATYLSPKSGARKRRTRTVRYQEW